MTRRSLISAVCVYFFLFGFGIATWASRLPALQSQCGLTNSELGFALLASSVGAFSAVPISAFIIGTLTSRLTALAATLVFANLIVTLSFAQSGVSLGIVLFCMGMTSGILDVAINTQAVAAERDHPKPMMSTFHALFSLGMAGGATAGGIFATVDLLAHFSGALALIATAALFVFKGFGPDRPRDSEEKLPRFTLPALGGPVFWLSCVAFCSMLAEGAVTEWSTAYMVQVVAASSWLAPQALTAFSLAMTAGRFGGDWVRHRYGDDRVLFAGILLGVFGQASSLAAIHPATFIVGTFLSGLGISILVPICFSVAGKVPGVRTEVSLAQVTTVGYLGFTCGPPIIGSLADRVGLGYALITIPIVLGASLVALHFAFSTPQQVSNTQKPSVG